MLGERERAERIGRDAPRQVMRLERVVRQARNRCSWSSSSADTQASAQPGGRRRICRVSAAV
jgi:hypothetical protein